MASLIHYLSEEQKGMIAGFFVVTVAVLCLAGESFVRSMSVKRGLKIRGRDFDYYR